MVHSSGFGGPFFQRLERSPAVLAVFVALIVGIASGCADFSSGSGDLDGASAGEAETPLDYIEVDSPFLVGAQCPFGSLPAPDSVVGALWDCEESQLKKLNFVEQPPVLQFQADCTKRLLTIRSRVNQTDITWQVLPDGRFVVPIDQPFLLRVLEDSPGLGPCEANAQVVISGQLNCTDRDRPEIQMDALWYLAPEPVPAPSNSASPSPSPSTLPSPLPSISPVPAPSGSPSPSPSNSITPLPSPSSIPILRPDGRTLRLAERACTFPKSCFIHVPHRLKQCP